MSVCSPLFSRHPSCPCSRYILPAEAGRWVAMPPVKCKKRGSQGGFATNRHTYTRQTTPLLFLITRRGHHACQIGPCPGRAWERDMGCSALPVQCKQRDSK